MRRVDEKTEMKADETAKNLLLDKSCDNCQHMIIDRGAKICMLNHDHVITINAALAPRASRNNTCANWAKRWEIGWHTDHEL